MEYPLQLKYQLKITISIVNLFRGVAVAYGILACFLLPAMIS